MFRKPSLLIVDDEANVLFTLKLVLEEAGTTAAGCSDALFGSCAGRGSDGAA
jgi:hypothetical protein